MKIRVFLQEDTPPYIGGGYTFTSIILSSLLNFASQRGITIEAHQLFVKQSTH